MPDDIRHMASQELTKFEIPDDLEPQFPARVVSAVQLSTDGMHLGDYFGGVRECTRLQYEYPGEAFTLIADYHALADQHHPDVLAQGTRSLALDYLALGLDPATSTLYRESDVPQACELMWILACVTRKSRLDRTNASRAAALDNSQLPSVGPLLYPALMAADILALRGTDVPLGDDQARHLEIACDVGRAFNRQWRVIFPAPRRRTTAAPTLTGVDGHSMSNIAANALPVFWCDDEDFEARVKRMVVGCLPSTDPIEPGSNLIFSLYRLVADRGKVTEMREGLERGKLGPHDVNQRLLSALRDYFAPYHERRRQLQADKSLVEEVLLEGARRASEEAEATLDVVRECVGLACYRRHSRIEARRQRLP